MAILSQSDLLAAAKYSIVISKTASATTVAAIPFTTLDLAGNPGAGTLTIGNTTTGLVPTDATAGFPLLPAFSGGRGYVASVDFGSSVASRLTLYDRLFHVGSISLLTLATTTLSSQPSYASRVSLNGGAANYANLQIWLEMNATASATAVTVQVQYTNESGTTGRLTNAQSMSSFTTRRLQQLALQTGDKGVQKIEAVIVAGTAATSGTFNVLVTRPLWTGRVRAANDGDNHGYDKTMLVEVFEDSAIGLMVTADGTTSGIPDMQLDLAVG